jgi:hypothetical protein
MEWLRRARGRRHGIERLQQRRSARRRMLDVVGFDTATPSRDFAAGTVQ